MEIVIRIDSALMSIGQAKAFLERQQATGAETIEFRMQPPKFRNVDPAVLVAIVGATGTAVGALITALVPLAKQAHARTIVIQTAAGQRLEIPADTSSERLEELIRALREMESPSLAIDIESAVI